MDDLIFSLILYVVMAMGMLSVAWFRNGMRGITDPLFKSLFRYLTALTILAVIFAIWVLVSGLRQPELLTNRFVTSISLVAIFALLSGASLAVKKIGDMYGFKVDNDYAAKKPAKAAAKKGGRK